MHCLVKWYVVLPQSCFLVERVCQYQFVLVCPVPKPLSPAVLLPECVSSDVFGVDCFCFVVYSELRVDVSANQHVRVRFPAPVSVLLELVARARLRIPCAGSGLRRLAI